MTRADKETILRACARFMSRRLEPLEPRLKALEGQGPEVVKLVTDTSMAGTAEFSAELIKCLNASET